MSAEIWQPWLLATSLGPSTGGGEESTRRNLERGESMRGFLWVSYCDWCYLRLSHGAEKVRSSTVQREAPVPSSNIR